MKSPQISQINLGSIRCYLSEGYLIKLGKDTVLLKNLPKIVDIVTNGRGEFEDRNKLQWELQELCDNLMRLEIEGKK
ncbi:hypothetical protein CMI37_30125 [Candidatus Pacearchaeota archaeon]|nr:hypothetical protein [Candidatus Pacearchaeota archaeon]|tara:strand:- start:17522 stop:17752 length:231 start_codon:yes stop_codon:yes gene_type:complete